MAVRMKSSLLFVISQFQSAFIPGRQIFDNVLVAFEILHSMSRQKSKKTGHMVLKLDMRKAYDRVEWSFLSVILKKMDFLDKWIRLIIDCISSSTLSFQLNGKVVCSITLQEV